MLRILAVDDEIERTEQIADWFSSIEFEVIRAHSGREGLQKAQEAQPDIILLDILMPEMDGHEVLLRLKRDARTAKIPVVICSFKADELDGLKELMRTGLREGADYVVARKWGLPALEEVVNRVLAMPEQRQTIRVGKNELKLGAGCAEVWINGEKEEMTRLEARVLMHLNDRRGQPCHVSDFLDDVYEGVGDPSSIYKIIARIRKKVEPVPKTPTFVLNVKGFGYKLTEGE